MHAPDEPVRVLVRRLFDLPLQVERFIRQSRKRSENGFEGPTRRPDLNVSRIREDEGDLVRPIDSKLAPDIIRNDDLPPVVHWRSEGFQLRPYTP